MILKSIPTILKTAVLALLLLLVLGTALPSQASADPCTVKGSDGTTAKHCCGADGTDADDTQTPVSIDLGCKSKGNPIMDMLFAAIRFLSYGVGLVIVGSLTYAGIQYTASRGDPNAHAQAVKRIQANAFALLLFVFAFAIVNYLVPGALLK
jgi:hypothetical protein